MYVYLPNTHTHTHSTIEETQTPIQNRKNVYTFIFFFQTQIWIFAAATHHSKLFRHLEKMETPKGIQMSQPVTAVDKHTYTRATDKDGGGTPKAKAVYCFRDLLCLSTGLQEHSHFAKLYCQPSGKLDLLFYLEVINISVKLGHKAKIEGHEHVLGSNHLELPIFNPLSLVRWQFHMVQPDLQVNLVGSSHCNTGDT